jgi:hypothetical protein
MFVCEAVKTVCVPSTIVRAMSDPVNTAGSILGTLAGAVLVVGAVAVDLAIHDDDIRDVRPISYPSSTDGPLFDGWSGGAPAKPSWG